MTSVGKLNSQTDLFTKRPYDYISTKLNQMSVNQTANSIGPLMWPNSSYDLDAAAAASAYSQYNSFYSQHSHLNHSSPVQLSTSNERASSNSLTNKTKSSPFWPSADSVINQQDFKQEPNSLNSHTDPFSSSAVIQNGASAAANNFWPTYSPYNYGVSSSNHNNSNLNNLNNLNSLNSNPVSNSVFNSATNNISTSFVNLPNSLANNLTNNLASNLGSNLTNNLAPINSLNTINSSSIKDELDTNLFENGLNGGSAAYSSLRSTPSTGYMDTASQNFHHFNFPHQHPNNNLSSTGK